MGPLAKYIVVYTKVKQGIITDPTWAESMMVRQIDTVSQVLGVPAHVWMTTMVGRTACRGLDAQVASNISQYFFDKLVANIKNGDTTVADTSKFEPNKWPKDAKGVGLVDAPRGGLGHWIHIKDGRSANYQCIVLFWTGLYIGDPGFAAITGHPEPTFAIDGWFAMETMRRIHFIAGVILTFSFIFRFAGALWNRGDRLLPKFRQKRYWYGLRETTLHYLMIPQKHEHHWLRNSLARTAYMMVYIMFFFEIITGFSMYAMIDPNGIIGTLFAPIITLFGGEYKVHIIHHYIAWGFLFFTIIHVYMAFREDVMEESGEVSAMVSGMKYYAHDPIDIEDLNGKRRRGERIDKPSGTTYRPSNPDDPREKELKDD